MAAKRDLYEILGISKTADEKTIKKAYRKLAKKYHPDMNPGDKTAEQKFKEATDAYNILSDPEKRKLYDQYGHAAFDGTGAESEFYKNYQNYGGAHGGYQEFHFEGGDGDDIFGDIFGSMFGGGRNSKGFHRSSFHQGGFGSSDGFGSGGFGSGSFRQKGSDAHADISISFDEAVTGCDKVIHLQDQNGAMQSLQVHIPAGIDTGKSVRLRGKGNPGIGGGEAGDLFLKVTVGEKQGFERKGNDVYTTINVPFSTAVCGGEAVIKTLYGNVICKIKEGTQSGSKIRLRGKGMPLMKNPSQKGAVLPAGTPGLSFPAPGGGPACFGDGALPDFCGKTGCGGAGAGASPLSFEPDRFRFFCGHAGSGFHRFCHPGHQRRGATFL